MESRGKVDPFFNYFVNYNHASYYAHEVVVGALLGTGRYRAMSFEQRSQFVVATLKYQVTYMFALSQFYNSYTLCQNESINTTAVSLAWDRGVAFMVGSMEGYREGGAPISDGMLLYNLANQRCARFETCDKNGHSNMITIYTFFLIPAKRRVRLVNVRISSTAQTRLPILS